MIKNGQRKKKMHKTEINIKRSRNWTHGKLARYPRPGQFSH